MEAKSTKIDRSAPIPLYLQLKQIILNQINKGFFKPGDLTPTEKELSEAYKISRITVRSAIQELVQEGYLKKQQGKGTFVAQPKIRRVIGQLRSFSEDMNFSGRKPGSEVLDLRVERAVGQVAEALKLEEGNKVWVVERLRTVDDEPVAHNLSYLNLPDEEFLTREDLELEVSLWFLLFKKGVHITDIEDTVQAISANRYQSNLLNVGEGSPLLMVEGIAYGEDGRPVEYSHNINRADRFKYFVRKANELSKL